MGFWDSADNLEAIFSIFGLSLISIFSFMVEFIKYKRKNPLKNKPDEFRIKYNQINLKSCFTGVLFSIIAIILFKMYSFEVYKFISSDNIPRYSVALYALCLLPLPVAVIGALVGLVIGKRYL